MGVEIERKFLVQGEQWRNQVKPVRYVQGYWVAERDRTVRVRIAGDQGFLTLKGGVSGITRLECEYPISLADAEALMPLCTTPVIEKFRSEITFEGHVWEVDEFEGENKGLVLAEIELTHEQELFSLPPWVGEEVTEDPRYFNSRLAVHPYVKW